MNLELKALIAIAFDCLVIAQDAATRVNALKLISDAMMLLGDLPMAVAYWNDLQAEIKALPGSEQQKDLLAFIQTKLGSISGISNSAKAQAILNACIKLIEDMVADGIALRQAIQS